MSWQNLLRALAWLAFAAVAIGCGVGALVVGGHKGLSAVVLFSISACCSIWMAVSEFRARPDEDPADEDPAQDAPSSGA